jgi:hypothetical protein
VTTIGLLSAKHSPGVSTLASVFAALAAEQGPTLLVEADPSGGDLAARAGLRLEPGLATLAGAARRGATPGLLDAHVQALGCGAMTVVAPTSSEHACSALRALGGRLPLALASFDGVAIVDLGRWRADHPASELLTTISSAVLLVQPTIEGVEHARVRLDSLSIDANRLTVAVVGDRPYGADEIGRALGVHVRIVDFDRRTAEHLAGGVALDRWLRRSPLVRSARSLFEHLIADDRQAAEAAR